MCAEQKAKDFARWIIIHTEEVNTAGACRRYKGRVLNVEELYSAWENWKREKF